MMGQLVVDFGIGLGAIGLLGMFLTLLLPFLSLVAAIHSLYFGQHGGRG